MSTTRVDRLGEDPDAGMALEALPELIDTGEQVEGRGQEAGLRRRRQPAGPDQAVAPEAGRLIPKKGLITPSSWMVQP